MYQMESLARARPIALTLPTAGRAAQEMKQSPEAILLGGIRQIALFEKEFRGRFKDEKKEREFQNAIADVVIHLTKPAPATQKAFKDSVEVLKGISKDDLKGGFKEGEEEKIKKFLKAFEAASGK